MRRYVPLMLAVAAAVTVPAAQATPKSQSGGSADVDASVVATINPNIDATLGLRETVPNGGSTTIQALTFTVGVAAFNHGPDAVPSVTYGLELPPGLHWAPNQTNTDCPLTASAASCQATGPDGGPLPATVGVFDYWRVTADGPGTYLIKVSATGSLPDPNTANNTASASVIAQEQVVTKSLKVFPARPKAGSVVSARVFGITVGGEPVTPRGLSCSGTIAGTTLTGTAQATVGKATCAYRTPKAARHKQLRGVISFTASQTQTTKHFAVRLR